MAWSWFSSKKQNRNGEPVFGAGVRRAFYAAMGCFLSCLGMKKFDLDTPQDFVGSRKKNDLTLLFDSEDESRRGDEESVHLLSPEEREFKELEDEARFLKACGTIPHTPTEIRETAKKWGGDASAKNDEENAIDLWSENAASTEKLISGLSNESPTPVDLWPQNAASTRVDSLEDSALGCLIDGHKFREELTSSTESSYTQNVNTPIDVCHSESTTTIQSSDAGTGNTFTDGNDSESTGYIENSDAVDVKTPSYWSDGKSNSSVQSSDIGSVCALIDLCDSENRSVNSTASPMECPDVQLKNKSVRFECELDDSAHSPKRTSSDNASPQSRTPSKITDNVGAENDSAPTDLCDSENRSAIPPASPMTCTPCIQFKSKSVNFEWELDESTHSPEGISSDDASPLPRTPEITDSAGLENDSASSDSLDSENRSATSPTSPLTCTPSIKLQNKSVRFECEHEESAHSSKGTSSDDASQNSRTRLEITDNAGAENDSASSDLLDSENRSATPPMTCNPSIQLKDKSVRFECDLDESAYSSKSFSSEDASQESRAPFEFTGSDSHDSENGSEASPALSVACTPSVQPRYKSVRFEVDDSANSSKSSSSEDPSRHSRTPFKFTASATSVATQSPFPTPLKLTDDMQTPGTVFLSNRRNVDAAKAGRIRSQYAYPVPGPLEFEQKELASGPLQYLDTSLTLNGGATLPSTPSIDSDMEINHHANERGTDLDASLSSWLKPPAKKDGDNEQFYSFSLDNVDCESTPADRLNLALDNVDCESTPADRLNLALKSDVNVSNISPTLWDANGIPNTTHKYQEDQKVRYHTTPFEERLEKALSGETSISRELVNKVQPVKLDVIEESDSAPSPLSAHPESGA